MFSYAFLHVLFVNPLLFVLFCQPGFLPSDIAMPSPDAMSPSGLKSTSQFYSGSYPNNPRRRPPDGQLGTVVRGEAHFSSLMFSRLLPSLSDDLSKSISNRRSMIL